MTNEYLGVQVKLAVAALGTMASFIWGGWDEPLQILAFLLGIDYISGVAAAFKEKKLNSEVGAWGVAKKVGILVVVGVANLVDRSGGLAEPLFRSVVVYFYIANEGISILENAVRIGIPIPQVLKDGLDKLKGGKKNDPGN